MPEQREERIARKVSGLNDTLYRLTNQLAELKERCEKDKWQEVNDTLCSMINQIDELKEKYRVDMWQEVIEYIRAKKEVSK